MHAGFSGDVSRPDALSPHPDIRDASGQTESNAAEDNSTLLILGAGGYVGRELARHFHHRKGWRVAGLFHRTPSHEWCDESDVRDIFANDFRDVIPSRGRVVLINAAFDFLAVGRPDPGIKYRFLEAALQVLMHRPGCACINISSMSAFAGCRSDYGREKLIVEDVFSRHRGINVRPGLITSWERPGSAFLHLIRIVQKSRFVPYLISKNDGFFVCELEDLIAGIDFLIEMKLNKPHTVSFCYSNRVRLFDLLHMIRRRLTVQRLLLPVPWRFAYWLVTLKEQVSGRGKVRADSILDFGFPATSAQHRQFFARYVGRRKSADQAVRVSTATQEGFSFLELPRPARLMDRKVH